MKNIVQLVYLPFITLFLTFSSCGTTPATQVEEPLHWGKLKLDPITKPEIQKILSGSQALNPEKYQEGETVLRVPQIMQNGYTIRIVDYSRLSTSGIYGKLLQIIDFNKMFFRDQENGSFGIALHESNAELNVWYIDLENKKISTRRLYYNRDGTVEDIHRANKQYNELVNPSTQIPVITLSGSGLVEQHTFTKKDEKDTTSNIVWEGISFDPPCYIALQGKSSFDTKTELSTGTKVRWNYYQLIIIFYPDMTTLASALNPSVIYQNGYSVIDGFNKEGFDQNGYDKAGYDKSGWSGRTRYMTKVTHVVKDSPAFKAGINKEDVIQVVDGKPLLGNWSMYSIVSSHKPGDTIPIKIQSGLGLSKEIFVTLGSQPDNPESGFLGVNGELIEIGTSNSENRIGETWSGIIKNGRQGWGILTRKDGSRFIGNYKDDVCDGMGISVQGTKSPRIEEWRNGKLISSREPSGSIISPVYSWIYLGSEAEKGSANGHGNAVTSDGSTRILNGRFNSGRLVEGTMIFRDGSEYSGRFENDLLVKGTIKDNDGKLLAAIGVAAFFPDDKLKALIIQQLRHITNLLSTQGD